tara:strand:+ start:60419 stop:60835 length:417 start_codon:yes stop_codon:yes gene_type:complete
MSSPVEPSAAQLAEFSKLDQTKPIAMVNLLKFRAEAVYADGRDVKGMTGAAAYGLYGQVAMAKIAEVGGRMFWAAPTAQTFIGGVGDEWDMVAIVRYPNRAAFLRMTEMEDYKAASVHREAGLERTVLISCPGDTIPE